MIPKIRNHSYHQRIHYLDLISLTQRRLRGHIIELFNYLTTASGRESFDYDLNDRTRNYGAEFVIKHFNISVAQPFYPIKIATTRNAIPNEVVSSRTVHSFKNSFYKHWAENPSNVRVNWYQSSMPCTIQWCTNSRMPAFCWKLTQRSVLLLVHYYYYEINIIFIPFVKTFSCRVHHSSILHIFSVILTIVIKINSQCSLIVSIFMLLVTGQ